MGQDEDKNAPKPAPPERTAKGESLRDKVGPAYSILLTGVIGTMVATWFQQRGWAWQNKVTQVEKDTSSALDSLVRLRTFSTSAGPRPSRWCRRPRTLRQGTSAKATRDNFLAVNNDWELQYANPTPPSNSTSTGRSASTRNACPTHCGCFNATPTPSTSGRALDPDSAHTILTVINHCHDLVKSDIGDLGKAANDQTARQNLIDQSYFRLSNIYYIDDALRCVILERAVAMRRSLDTELSLGSFFQVGPKTYKIPAKERDCLAQYREWSSKNRPKQQ